MKSDPDGWVKFETLDDGDKFHDVRDSGMPIQYIKMCQLSSDDPNAVDLDTGKAEQFDPDEFVCPIDAGWVAELRCYGFKISEELEKKGHEEILAEIMPQTDARKANDHWREEITKYLPQLGFMSFAGAKRTIQWLMNHVEIKPEFQEMTANLLAVESSIMSDEEKIEKRLEIVFPNLGKRIK